MLADGTPAPDFRLLDQDGNPVALEDFRGKWLVFWWFPKAATAG
jgi:peroxiredoxin Q/BCP